MSALDIRTLTSTDALHKPRLLNVEEKPFKRITKRLLGSANLISNPTVLPPTPPLDASAADEEAAAHQREKQRQSEERKRWREDALLDFAAFESSIIRIQFLLTSNIKERERYSAERIKIQNTSQAVRDNTVDLRAQLEEAQKTLAVRKEYDTLAEKITNNRSLKPRDEQQQNLEKLNSEIADLERESQEYAQTWAERRDQFGKIIEEGMQLRRLIRDEKEEVERREGMEGREGEDEDQKGRISGVNTPKPESTGEETPMHGVEKDGDAPTPAGLGVDRVTTRGTSPLIQATTDDEMREVGDEKDDEEMAEDGELAAEPENMIAEPVGGLVANFEDQDAELNQNPVVESMDVT